MIFLERAHFHSEDPVESRIEWLELLYFCMASSYSLRSKIIATSF